MKRVVVISDPHCGHDSGLTPPGWQVRGNGHTGKRNKLHAISREVWKWYDKKLAALQPIFCLIVNGDCIDGPGKRSGGTELITADMEEQCKMAEVAIKKANAKHIIMTYGTAYHTGQAEDWENILAYKLGAKIGSHEWVTVEGVTFDCKHHVGSSSVPYARHTAVAKEHTWAQLWQAHDLQPESQVILRSHVHYYGYCGGSDWIAFTTPPLQGMGSKYGARRCTGIVDVGLLNFDCDGGEFVWQAHIAKLQKQKAQATIL